MPPVTKRLQMDTASCRGAASLRFQGCRGRMRGEQPKGESKGAPGNWASENTKQGIFCEGTRLGVPAQGNDCKKNLPQRHTQIGKRPSCLKTGSPIMIGFLVVPPSQPTTEPQYKGRCDQKLKPLSLGRNPPPLAAAPAGDPRRSPKDHGWP